MGWNPDTLEGFEGEESLGIEGGPKRQVAFFGIYDGLVPYSSSSSFRNKSKAALTF